MEEILMDTKFPIGKLQVEAHPTLDHVKQWLSETESYVARLREVIDPLTEEELSKKYREDSWNVRQLVHHIADSQLIMFQRLKLALTDDNPTVPNFIQDKWAVQADTELPVEASIQILDGLNQRIVALGKTLTEADLQRKFIHELNGEITVATKLAKLAWHEEHHLAHIKLALSK